MKNITIRYYLVNKIKDLEKRVEPEPVWAEISGAFINNLNGVKTYKKFKFSLDTKIKPIYFGSIQEKRGVKNFKYDNAVINNNKNHNRVLRIKMLNLEECKDFTIQHFNRINTYPTILEFQSHLKQLVRGNTTTKEDFTFLYFLEKHIKNLEELIGSGSKLEVKDVTINMYRNLIPHLNRYNKTNPDLKFSNLTEKKYNEFWEFVKTKGLEKTTIKSYQTYFLATCKQAKKEGIEFELDLTNENLIISTKDIKPSEKTEAYLSEDDLQKIIDFKITVKKTCRSQKTLFNLERTKEYIIIASYTGMRVQSMIDANARKIKEYKDDDFNFWHIQTYQEKTKTECLTPIFPKALEIIKKNNNQFPDFTTNWITLANLNLNIRKLLKGVGIKNSHLFSTKNFRNTYITNLALLGIDEALISIVTHPDKLYTTKSTHIYNRMKPLNRALKYVRAIKQIENKETSYKL